MKEHLNNVLIHLGIFYDLKNKVQNQDGYNSNFEFDKLSWNTQVWLYAMCELVDEKLDEVDERIYNNDAI